MDQLLKRWQRVPPIVRVELVTGGWECFSALLFVSAVYPDGFDEPMRLLVFGTTLLLSALATKALCRRGGRGIDAAAALRVLAWLVAFTPISPDWEARQLVATFVFGLMAGGIRRAAYRRLLPGSVVRRLPRSLQNQLLPLLGENAMVVGIVGGQVMLLFSVAFMRTTNEQVFRAWRDAVPVLGILGTVGFTLALRPLCRPLLDALAAGPTAARATQELGLRRARALPRRLSLVNFAVWTTCIAAGLLYLHQRGDQQDASWTDQISKLAFGILFSWGVSVYQRGWHEDTVAPVIRRLRAWAGDAPDASADELDAVTLQQRMLSEFGLPLLFTLALSLLASIGLYRSLGPELSRSEDFSAIAALCASFAMLVLAVGSVFARAARQLSEPLSKLARTADQVASGKLDAAVPQLRGPREVVGLGESVERMRRELAHTIEELRKERASLETRVQQRTAELRKTLEELKQAQAALIQGERMALIGELVASVAHEIYNPLNAIGGSISSLDRVSQELSEMLQAYRQREPLLPADEQRALADKRDELDADGALEDLAGVVKVVRNATRRSVTIVSNLKSFARAPADPIPSDLHAGLRETLSLLRHRLVQGGVEVVEHYGELPEVTCRTGEINQVFMNLLSNAIQAAAAEQPHGKGRIEVTTLADKDGVIIRVSDNGPGVDEAIAERIFDPFFTTKTSEGTGLGLSISRDIVRRHGGSLMVGRADGGGALFSCRLPLVPPPDRDSLKPSSSSPFKPSTRPISSRSAGASNKPSADALGGMDKPLRS